MLHDSHPQQCRSALQCPSSCGSKTDRKAAQQEPSKTSFQTSHPHHASASDCDSAWRERARTHRKNATRDRDRSSSAVRDEAKIDLNTAGVTGMRLRLGDGGGRPAFGGSGPEPVWTYTEFGCVAVGVLWNVEGVGVMEEDEERLLIVVSC